MKRAAWLLLALSFWVVPVLAQSTMPSNHVTPMGEGEVDWTEGVLRVTGFGKAKDSSPQARLNALRAAQMTAMAKALRSVMEIPLDSEIRLGERGDFKVRVEGRVRGAKTVAERKVPGGMEVDLEIPLGGIEGLVKEILPLKAGAQRTSWRFQEGGGEKAEDSWVYLDARGLGLTEALLPKVLDDSGTVLYDPSKPSDMNTAESVVYMSAPADEAEQAFAVPQGAQVLKVRAYQGQGKGKAKRKRGGPRGHTVKGGAAKGKIPADLVLDKSAAEKMKKDPALAKAIKDGRVVIVTDSKVGGTRGKDRPRPVLPQQPTQMARF